MPLQTVPTIQDLLALTAIVTGRPHADPPKPKAGVDLQVIAEVLVAALSEISEPNRWCQGSPFVLPDGQRVADLDDLKIYGQKQLYAKCSEGAIHFAAYWQGHSTKIALQTVQLLERYVGMPLYDWNDGPERKHAEVLDLFRRAIGDIVRVQL